MNSKTDNDIAAVLLAAGASERMGENKLLLRFAGKTVLRLSYEALRKAYHNMHIIITTSAETVSEAQLIAEGDTNVILANGGSSRSGSVYNALKKLKGRDVQIVLIHDAARFNADESIIRHTVGKARLHGSGIAAVPVRDALKRADGKMVEREGLYAMQTPQTFNFERILSAYESAIANNMTALDDAEVYAAMGYELHFVEGSLLNQKLTFAGDVSFFDKLMGDYNMRTGFGEDTHILVLNRALILGGISIEYGKGLLGNSDADVLTHAVIDALLGAAALGDIGQHFPIEAQYKDADSVDLLKTVVKMLQEKDYSICNVDATVIAQAPKLVPHILKMRECLAKAMQIDISNVSVKATTSEGINAEGRGECITARAVATIK